MSAVLDRQDSDITAHLEARALEKMIAALCRDTERLANEASGRGELESREARLQLEAFAERRAEALERLQDAREEPAQMRIGRLEKLVEALDCSRSYFRGAAPGTT